MTRSTAAVAEGWRAATRVSRSTRTACPESCWRPRLRRHDRAGSARAPRGGSLDELVRHRAEGTAADPVHEQAPSRSGSGSRATSRLSHPVASRARAQDGSRRAAVAVRSAARDVSAFSPRNMPTTRSGPPPARSVHTDNGAPVIVCSSQRARRDTPGPGSTRPSRTPAASGSSGRATSTDRRSVPLTSSKRSQPGGHPGGAGGLGEAGRAAPRPARGRPWHGRRGRSPASDSSSSPSPTTRPASPAARSSHCRCPRSPASGCALRRGRPWRGRGHGARPGPSRAERRRARRRCPPPRPSQRCGPPARPPGPRARDGAPDGIRQSPGPVPERQEAGQQPRRRDPLAAPAAASSQCRVNDARAAPDTGPWLRSSSRTWTGVRWCHRERLGRCGGIGVRCPIRGAARPAYGVTERGRVEQPLLPARTGARQARRARAARARPAGGAHQSRRPQCAPPLVDSGREVADRRAGHRHQPIVVDQAEGAGTGRPPTSPKRSAGRPPVSASSCQRGASATRSRRAP